MKYRIIIADDEFFIRQKLKLIIHYEELCLELTGDFENGREVIDFLKTDSADIILLDIRMPHVSGLDVARYVSENHPEMKVVILSGYNDFEYARTTLRYGVSDYLLKPVNEDDLNTVLKKCVDMLNLMHQSKARMDSLTRYERRLALASHLKDHSSMIDLTAIWPEFASAGYCAFFAFYVEENCQNAAESLTAIYTENHILCEYFIESENIFYLQLFLSEEEDFPLCQYLGRAFLRQLSFRCCYFPGSPVAVSEDWQPSLTLVLDSLDYRYFSDKKDLSLYTPENSTFSSIEISSIRSTLLPLLNMSDADGMKNYIGEIFRAIRESGSPARLHMVITEIFATFSVKYSDLRSYRPLPKDYVQSLIMEEHSLEKLQTHIENYGLTYIKCSDTLPSDIRLCRKITDYLLSHYSDPDLSVSSIADYFGLNPSYLGNVFKKVNNKSILQFLTTIRMTEARNLLMTHQYKIFEIAEKVGYSDVFYFSKRFKKYYGYPPTSFPAPESR